MIKSIEISHIYGEYNHLTMILESPEESEGYAVKEVKGLTPGKTNIGTTDWAIIDGSSITTNRLPKRTISFDIVFIEGLGRTIEQMRDYIYLYFPIKKKVKITIHRTNGQSFYIHGYVEKNEPKIWSKQEGVDIDILCPDPYFKDTEADIVDFIEQIDYWHFDSFTPRVEIPDESLDFPPRDQQFPVFPISEIVVVKERDIDNDSNVDVGLEMKIHAYGVVENPGIMNETSNEMFRLIYTMSKDEEITIITRDAEYSVTSNKNGNILQYVDLAINDWIKAYPGRNHISIFCDSEYGLENMNLTITTRPIYAGV